MHGADEALVGEEVDVERLLQHRRRRLMRGCQRAERAGSRSEGVELAEAFEQRRREMIDGVEVGEIERHERRFALASSLDLVVKRLQRLLRARYADDAPAAARKLQRDCTANAAR